MVTLLYFGQEDPHHTVQYPGSGDGILGGRFRAVVIKVKISISNALNDGEWKLLSSFCTKVRRLLATKMVSGGDGAIKGNIKVTPEAGMCCTALLPPEEQIAEFLMAFRFFYSQKEPTYFPNILSLIGRHASEKDARQALKSLGSQWKNSLFANGMQISVDEEPITSSLLLDVWLNAHYFHSDEEKSRRLYELHGIFSEQFAKYMLLDAVFAATKVVIKVYEGIREIVDRHQSP